MGHELTLGELIALWERTRDPRVADAIDVVGARVKPRVIAGKTLRAKLLAWGDLARKGDPDDVSTLVAFPFPTGIRSLEQLVAGLIALPADPRVAKRLTDLVVELPVDSWAGCAITAKGCDRLAALGDVRAVPRLVATRHTAWVASRLRVPAALEVLAAVTPQPVADDILAPFAVAVRDHAVDETFLAQIYANPDDDAAITVYGDYLVEHGDPRGELIALQLAGDRGKRVRELVLRHHDAWTGSLARWFSRVEDRVFERGFFAGGRLGEAPTAEALAGDRAWRLVHTLWVRSLAELEAWSHPVRALHVDELDPGEEFAARLARLPTLRTFGVVRGATGPWARSAAILDRLERFVTCELDEQALEAIAARRAPRVVELAMTGDSMTMPQGWRLRLERDVAPGPFTRAIATRVDGTTGARPLLGWLGLLPATWICELVVDQRAMLLDADEAEQAEVVLRRFAQATRVEVPWHRPERDDAAGSLAIEFQLDGNSTEEDRLPVVWATLQQFGQRYDVFTVGRGDARRPLGKDPVARIQKWAKGRWLEVMNSGGRERLRIGERLGMAGTLVMRDRTTAQLREVALALVATTGATQGVFGPELHTIDAGKFTNHAYASWLVLLGPAFTRWIDPADFAAMASATVVAASGPSVTLALGDDPARVTSEHVVAFAAELRAMLRRGFVRRHGYDFAVELRAAFDPIAREHAIPLAREATLEVRYATSLLELDASLGVAREPRLTVFVRSRRNVDPSWHRITEGRVVGTAAELRAALADAVARMHALHAWFVTAGGA